MTIDELHHELDRFFQTPDPALKGDLSEALYAAGEARLFPDYCDTVSVEQAILLWKIVEKMRVARFPDRLSP